MWLRIQTDDSRQSGGVATPGKPDYRPYKVLELDFSDLLTYQDLLSLCKMPDAMKPAYQLKNDTTFIAQVQNATRNTDDFGIEMTHGLFGSQEWWEQIASGKLTLHTLRGVITERFWSGMADWPMIKVESDTGEISDWTRQVNTNEQDALYIPGQRLEIDYVLQRHRPKSVDGGAEVKQVIEVRVEPSAQMEVEEAMRSCLPQTLHTLLP